ncbi:HNH endonuclease [Ilumatobacter sp.]|uniref:HNH endonuclease signature motif containing protein n=1 Tax=Ilumatobacter sp. TaxID=1967498 RepID=UPI003AF87ECD
MSKVVGRSDEAEAALAEAAGVLNVANARLVRITERSLIDESWVGDDVHTPAQWLTYRAGVSPERAQVIVRVAERRASFPCVMAAFDAGELSLEQAAELVKAPEWADELVLDWGRVATVARLRKTIRREWFTEAPDHDEPDASTSERDRVTTTVTDDHRWHLHGELDLGRGAVVDAAMIEARDSLFERGQSPATNADCLVEICERYLDGIESPVRRERSKTWVHIDVTDGLATTTDGWRLPDTVRDRICCDGSVQPVWERDGVPFSVGRTQRIVPGRTRRVIERRDRGCRVPGCTNDRFLEVHHIVHWLAGGPTDTWNLISLCPRHHRLHHQGVLGISGTADEPDGAVFTDARGSPLPPCGRASPPTGDVPPPTQRYQPPPMGRVDYSWVGLGWVHPDERRRRTASNRQTE